jgi:hypothetical protein
VAGHLFGREKMPECLVPESRDSVTPWLRSDNASAAIPGCDRALTAATFKGQVELLWPHTRRELGKDQHLFHNERLVASRRPGLLDGCLEERDPSALIVDEQPTAVLHYV